MQLTNVTVEQVEPNLVLLDAEVGVQDVDDAVRQVYHELSKQVSVPGFRKGKIPKEILRQRLGRDAIRQEAITRLMPPAFASAVVETGIEPLEQVGIEIVDFDESSPFRFKTKVVTRPAVELGDYEHFEGIEPAQVEVTDEQVQQELEDLRRRYAKYEDPGDRDIQNGDAVWGTLAVTLAGDDKPIRVNTLRPFVVGDNSLIPSLDPQVLGLKMGDVAEFAVTYPDDFPEEDLAGKPARFKFDVGGFRERQLPELDNSLAREMGSFDSYEDLENALRRLLARDAATQAIKKLEDQLIGQVVERSSLDLPEVLVEKRSERRLRDLEEELKEREIGLADYIENMGIDPEELREKMRDRVELDLRSEFVLAAIAEKENLTASEEEIAERIRAMAKSLKESPTELRRKLEASNGLDVVRADILERRACRLIVERSGLGLPEEDEPAEAEDEEQSVSEEFVEDAIQSGEGE